MVCHQVSHMTSGDGHSEFSVTSSHGFSQFILVASFVQKVSLHLGAKKLKLKSLAIQCRAAIGSQVIEVT